MDDDGVLSGLLLYYDSLADGGRWLECEVDALREGLAAAPTAPIVGFFPDDVPVPDVSHLVASAVEALSRDAVVASLVPVTDAVKRVDGRRVVGGVDRSRLRRVQGPVFARTDVVQRAVRGAAGASVIRPLVAAAQLSRLQIGRLDAQAAS